MLQHQIALLQPAKGSMQRKVHGSDQNLDRLIEFIKTERMCCDFFTFQITIKENSALLNITGPTGAKEFLKEEVDL